MTTSKEKIFEAEENAGALKPTGSKKWKNRLVAETYLNIGIGNACAGHNKAKLSFVVISKVKLLAIEEKVGALNPTGSTK